MSPRLPHTNKHSERSNVGRVETTNMLYIAGYQETWMLLRSSPNTVPQRPITAFAALPGIELRQAYCEWRGSWLHEVGLDGDLSLKAKKREAVLRLLAPALEVTLASARQRN